MKKLQKIWERVKFFYYNLTATKIKLSPEDLKKERRIKFYYGTF